MITRPISWPEKGKNLLTQKGKKFADPKREKFSVEKKGKIRPISWSEKRENFSDQKGKNLKFLKFFPFFGQDEKGKNFEPVGGSGQLVDPIDDS